MKFHFFLTTTLALVKSPFQQKPLVVGHRGSPSNTPEHTLVSYQLAIDQGADYVEPDLVVTKDGYLVARHENEISNTTNVSEFIEFKGRKTTKTIDGKSIDGWFTEDFTLEELKRLRARERIPLIRPNNTRQDDLFEIPTLEEIIELVQQNQAKLGKKIGIYPETKHPSYFASIGLPFEGTLLEILSKYGYEKRTDKVMIQSFELWNLQYLRSKSDLYLVQLVNQFGTQPYDLAITNDHRYSQDLVTFHGLKEIAKYADAVSPFKEYLIPRDTNNQMTKPTLVIENAHRAGLHVHTWTMRPETVFLPNELRGKEGMVKEIRLFLEAGIDGFFTDSPDLGRLAVDFE